MRPSPITPFICARPGPDGLRGPRRRRVHGAAAAPRADEPGSEGGDHALAPPTGGLDAAALPFLGAFTPLCPGCAAGEDAQGQFEGHDHPVYGCLRDLH